MRRKRLLLVHQGVWRAKGQERLPPMPLACGYLKAAIESDDHLRSELQVDIVSLAGGESIVEALSQTILGDPPDMIAFSVFGWNYHLFGRIAEVFRSMKPDGWIIFGGTHVANQADRVFSLYPCVDIVANGEGEHVFVEIIRAWLSGVSPRNLGSIPGISYWQEANTPITKAPPARIADLNAIVSPFLSGALELKDPQGRFRYESGLLETNRGCPYRCSFCYWGGAIGQRVRAFALDRLKEEIDLLARARVEFLTLCDANFGMLAQDEEFIEICIRARERHGYPRQIMTSWAKDKRKPFYRAVTRMKEAGFHSSFNLALQTLSEPALETMQRRNMRINDWKELACWLQAQGMAVYAELIWGCPGDTYDSFLKGYDELAAHVTRIASYPLLVLPNTAFHDKKTELKMVVCKNDSDDFERVLSHHSMPLADNRRMHAFLFWSRVVAEHLLLRFIWIPLRELASVTQSQLLLWMDEWLQTQNDASAQALRACRDRAVRELDVGSAILEHALQFFFGNPQADGLMLRWWNEAVAIRLPESCREVLADIFRFDWHCRPIYGSARARELRLEEAHGESRYVQEAAFEYDVLAILRESRAGRLARWERSPGTVRFSYRTGFCNDMALYHNTHNEAYFGQPENIGRPVLAPASLRS